MLLILALVSHWSPGFPAQTAPPRACWVYQTPDARFRLEIVASGLHIPVSLAFLPDRTHALLAERPTGRLSLLDLNTGATESIGGTPKVVGTTDGGLQEVVLHPDFTRNGWIYFAYAEPTDSGNALVVERGTLKNRQLVDRQRLFSAKPYLPNDNEFGSRLVIDKGFLYITVGQRDSTKYAQRLDTDLGKIIRLSLDGRVPADNPFVRRPGALPEIWSFGNRNPQGLAINPATGELWEHEHGPRGGDEINLIRPGLNYGWPVVTFGIEYSGEPVGAGLTAKTGMEPPRYHWEPSIAPSGMAFYTGAGIPAWRGNLFLGAMAYRHLNRIVLDGGRVIREERLLLDRGWRVREVRESLDGLLYLGVDSGYVARIRPDDGRRTCARGAGPMDPLERTAATGPELTNPRFGYDAVRRVVVALGTGPGDGASRTWEWDGSVWRARSGVAPPARADHVMTSDPQAGIVLFGGVDRRGKPLGDTWRYYDSTWRQLDVSGPSPRGGAGIGWDFDHSKVFLFGGAERAGTVSAETWRWDGRSWSRLDVRGPPGRRDAAMAYDPTRRSVVVFGGRSASGTLLGDTWLWDGKAWSPLTGTGPPARAGATLIYSWTRNAMLLVGGRSAGGSEPVVWELTHNRWAPAHLTLPEADVEVVADQARGRLVFLTNHSPPRTWLMVR